MIKIFQVDAFTNQPFKGNPAGVCILEAPVPDQWMQSVANEMNLAETAFLWSENDGYRLRWFTPETEVKLCGHATLASAHILWDQKLLQPYEQLSFFTLSGNLTASQEEDWIVLDFPKIEAFPTEIPEILKTSIDIKINLLYESSEGYSIVLVNSEDDVKSAKVDFDALKKYKGDLVIITAISTGNPFDFVSRVFVPKYGINEDPVTGSAHCCLVHFWNQLTGKSEFTAYQASSRGGVVRLQLSGNRVKLIGQAVKVLEGTFLY